MTPEKECERFDVHPLESDWQITRKDSTISFDFDRQGDDVLIIAAVDCPHAVEDLFRKVVPAEDAAQTALFATDEAFEWFRLNFNQYSTRGVSVARAFVRAVQEATQDAIDRKEIQ